MDSHEYLVSLRHIFDIGVCNDTAKLPDGVRPGYGVFQFYAALFCAIRDGSFSFWVSSNHVELPNTLEKEAFRVYIPYGGKSAIDLVLNTRTADAHLQSFIKVAFVSEDMGSVLYEIQKPPPPLTSQHVTNAYEAAFLRQEGLPLFVRSPRAELREINEKALAALVNIVHTHSHP